MALADGSLGFGSTAPGGNGPRPNVATNAEGRQGGVAGLDAGTPGSPHPWPQGGSNAGPNGAAAPNGQRNSCTAPQLRRFIKSRVYVPMHELRRRFQIDGPDDEVTAIHVAGERLYIGLPDREGRLLGELLRGGDVGYELSMDPPSPIVVGLYPMRPIPRL